MQTVDTLAALRVPLAAAALFAMESIAPPLLVDRRQVTSSSGREPAAPAPAGAPA